MRDIFRALGGLFLLLSLALLGACNGGGSSGTPSTLSGTAAVGAPIDGYVYVMDVNGIEVNTATDPASGDWTVSVGGMTAPFMIKAVVNGSGATYYSYAGSANVTVNVTPLTHLAAYLAFNGDLDALYNAWTANHAQLTAQAIRNAQAVINANFATLMQNAGLDHTVYDFFSTAFTANSTGIDALLDLLSISINFSGSSFTVSVSGDAGFSFDVNIDTSGIDIGAGGNNGGGGSNGGSGGTLPEGVASQIVTMTYCCAASGSPYTNGEEVLFTFSGSGYLFLTDQYTLVSETFTVSQAGNEYTWVASNGVKYTLAVLNGEIHEVNIFSSNGTFLGQFADPVPFQP